MTTPLLSAIRQNDMEAICFSLTALRLDQRKARGVDAGPCDKLRVALNDALVEASERGFVEVARYLVAFGADVAGATKEQRFTTLSALDVACLNGHSEMATYLIEELNSVTHYWQRPMSKRILTDAFSYACKGGHPEIAAVLANTVGREVLLEKVYENNNNALHLTCQQGFLDLTVYLAAKALPQHLNWMAKNSSGERPHQVALLAGHTEIARYLMEAQDMDIGVNILLPKVLEMKQYVAAQQLIQDGAYANLLCSNNRMAPLHYACRDCNEHPETLPFIRVLLEHGAFVDIQDGQGQTPLAKACTMVGNSRSGRVPTTVKTLLENGADPNIPDWRDTTPLMAVCGYPSHNSHNDEIRLEVLGYLVKWGANVNTPNRYNRTPLHVACAHGDETVVKFLLEHGATVDTGTNMEDKNNKTTIRASVNARDEDDNTPLHLVCECLSKGGLPCIELLLKHGADGNALSRWGDTPLLRTFYRLHGIAKAKYFLSIPGTDTSHVNDTGHSALTKAVDQESFELVQLILDTGVSATDAQGWKALEIACARNCLDNVFVLVQARVAELSDLSK